MRPNWAKPRKSVMSKVRKAAAETSTPVVMAGPVSRMMVSKATAALKFLRRSSR
jgi:hypothetical protein